MTRYVADSSISLAWCLEDEQDAYADAALAALDDGEAEVPPLWQYEVANGLWVAYRRGCLTLADIPQALALLERLPVRICEWAHDRARREVLELACREGIACYDAAYLDLALLEGLPLATLDRQLRTVAQRLGIPLFKV